MGVAGQAVGGQWERRQLGSCQTHAPQDNPSPLALPSRALPCPALPCTSLLGPSLAHLLR